MWYVIYFGSFAWFLEVSLFLLPVTIYFLSRQDFLIWGTGFWNWFCSFRIRVKRDLFFRVWLATAPRASTQHHRLHFSTPSPTLLQLEEEEPLPPPSPRKWGFYRNIVNLQSISNNVIPIFLPTLIFIHFDLFKSGHLALTLAVRKCHKTDSLNVAMFKRAGSPPYSQHGVQWASIILGILTPSMPSLYLRLSPGSRSFPVSFLGRLAVAPT